MPSIVGVEAKCGVELDANDVAPSRSWPAGKAATRSTELGTDLIFANKSDLSPSSPQNPLPSVPPSYHHPTTMADLYKHLQFLVGSSSDGSDDRRAIDEWSRSVVHLIMR